MAKYYNNKKDWTKPQKKEHEKNEEAPIEPIDTNSKDNKKKKPILPFGGRYGNRPVRG